MHKKRNLSQVSGPIQHQGSSSSKRTATVPIAEEQYSIGRLEKVDLSEKKKQIRKTIKYLQQFPDVNLLVYCDGGCLFNGHGNKARAGVGVYFGPNDPRNISCEIPGKQTNNCAELYAILGVLEACRQWKGIIHIFTDSSYSIDCLVKWYGGWVRNGWKTSKGKPVENVDLIQLCAEEIRSRPSLSIKFHHVPGHSGIEGNEEADRLANDHMETGESHGHRNLSWIKGKKE